MSIYILQKGDYHRNRNVLATTDVKKVAKHYVELIKNNAFGSLENPYIEVWNEEDEDYPTFQFHENIDDEKKLIKFLSKKAENIE